MCPRQGSFTLLLLVGLVTACSVPEQRSTATSTHSVAPASTWSDSADQVSTYIRCIFQDRDGNLWFGTTTDGAVRYDGHSLDHFNARNGFGSDWVNAIAQDAHGDLWFATRDGAVRYDGATFLRYTTTDGLASDHIWSMLVDRDDGLWFGTYEGVSRFQGGRFSAVPIPAADLSKHPYYEDPKLIQAIVQDKAGAIWFATKVGAYRYSGDRLMRCSGPDSLCSDFVNTILQENSGRLLFGTRFSGLCAFMGNTLDTVFAELGNENVGMLYQQTDGTLWMGLNAVGLCRSDGATLTRYDADDGAGIRVVFCMLEDDRGRLWVGTGAGLYRYEGGRFTNVTKEDLLEVGLQ